MTTPSVDRPVEPMTDDEARILVCGLTEPKPQPFTVPWGHVLLPQREFDALVARSDRALPPPRRYTGGPLEDGLYLWRPHSGFAVGPDHWDSVRHGGPDFCSQFVTAQMLKVVKEQEWVWLIGPITIPDIPSEEASS